MKTVELLPGSQRDFVKTQERYSAYIGGVGSGKTFAGAVKGIEMSQQPKVGYHGPRGVAAAASYRMLEDVVLPQFMELLDGTGLLKVYRRKDKKAILTNGAEIWFRSLDDPQALRGPNISWFFIDEGRQTNRKGWDVLIGRIRQKGYKHQGWVTSTPNGYDWMWQLFAPESPNRLTNSTVFFADTRENVHLDPEYRKSLEASYEGKFFEQEVMGQFVGLLGGAVFPEWDIESQFKEGIRYNPSLPLYSFWDFGVGDLGVCLFAQVDHKAKQLPDGSVEFVPELIFLDAIEAANWDANEWSRAYYKWLRENADGRIPNGNYGDPAGKQRGMATKTSVIDALRAKKVMMNAAPKKPVDFGIFVLRNLMEGGRVIVSKEYEGAQRIAQAFVTHKWETDEDGNRVGKAPVHDWTSHYGAAARYGVASLPELSYHASHRGPVPPQRMPVGSAGWAFGQLMDGPDKGRWIGRGERSKKLKWHPRMGALGGRD